MDLDKARILVRARSFGFCEGCGKHGYRLDPHHRQARGAGGVSGEAAERANDVRNILALCRVCHDETEHGETWALTEEVGWRIPKWVTDPWVIPALIHTVNGYGWYELNKEAGYRWIDPESPPTLPGVTWRRRTPDPLRMVELAGSAANLPAADLRLHYGT